MTDLRHLKNHAEPEEGGTWVDVVVSLVFIFAVVAVIHLAWYLLPGATSVDEVLQISHPVVERAR